MTEVIETAQNTGESLEKPPKKGTFKFSPKRCSLQGGRFCILGKTNLAYQGAYEKKNPPIGLFA